MKEKCTLINYEKENASLNEEKLIGIKIGFVHICKWHEEYFSVEQKRGFGSVCLLNGILLQSPCENLLLAINHHCVSAKELLQWWLYVIIFPLLSNESERWESWIRVAGKLLSCGIYLNKFTSHLLFLLVRESYLNIKQYAVFIGPGLLFSCLWAYFPGQLLPVLAARFSHSLSFS